MSETTFDAIVFSPRDIDLSRSPIAQGLDADTYVLGAFNPGLARLPNGNLQMMVRVAEALKEPVLDSHVRSIRCDGNRYVLDHWPLAMVEMSDPRTVMIKDGGHRALALTSLSWLLPVELSSDGRKILDVHYDYKVVPTMPYQCYGVEDARISRIGDGYVMTTCSVSPERQCTTLYTSNDALNWALKGIVLDHQNKDMLIFQGDIEGTYWAQTRPLGEHYFAYPPGSDWRSGPSINLATSPDLLHWKPCDRPGIRPHAATSVTSRIGGGAPPIKTEGGWLSLWHGVEPSGKIGMYRTFWTLLDRDDPSKTIRTEHKPLIEPSAALTAPLHDLMYLSDIVFTTGIVEARDHFIVASGEADLACRITHVPKTRFD